MAKKQTTKQTTTNKQTAPPKMPKNYSLLKAIREEKDYKSNTVRRDKNARNFFGANQIPANRNKLKIGSLYLMDYFEPKTKDQLEYYDAMPCSIFFGNFKNEKGEPRVIAFNIHYYPPRIRFQVLDRVMKIFEPFYQKQWASSRPNDLSYFSYGMLLSQLRKAKLEFGVRMYIPSLIGDCYLVEPRYWSKAVFTEGRFKKRTRQAILNYWKNLKVKKGP